MPTQYLIVGNGVAGTTAAENIRAHDASGQITMLSREQLPFYHRIRLIDYLAGAVDEAALVVKKTEWYAERNITILTGTMATSINPTARSIQADNGLTYHYGRLLLANGSHPFVPPITGSKLPGVFTLHTIADARVITEAARTAENVVVIGGGLLGLEAGNSLRKSGKQVTVVEFSPRLLPRQLDPAGAAILQHLMESKGFRFRLGAVTERISGGLRTEQIVLKGGEILAADLVIIAAGVRPDLNLITPHASIARDRGIIVNDRMQTTADDIFAAGDVAQWHDQVFGIWPAAQEQGKIAGLNMAGIRTHYNGTTSANVLKVADIKLASAGDIDPENRLQSFCITTPTTYHKLIIDQGKVSGCIMLGETGNFFKLTKAIAERQPVSTLASALLTPFLDQTTSR